MKKVIDGASYNTQTAKKICEQRTSEHQFRLGANVNQLKELYKTKTGNYFFYIENEFSAHMSVDGDDIDPKFELMDVKEEKIIPIIYKLAVQFASEVITSNPESQKVISNFFPELIRNKNNEKNKIQKKVYLSDNANRYLEIMLTESKETNSSFIENLIVEKYRSLFKEGVMQEDPYFEMEDQ